MWTALFLYLASFSLLKAEEEAKNVTAACTVPPHPAHGVLIVTESPVVNLYPYAGDKLAYYKVEIFCDLGFENLGVNYQSCAENGTLFGNMDIECLPYCEAQADDRILSCGRSPRCVKLPETCPTIKSRSNLNAEDDECGIVHEEAKKSAPILNSGSLSSNSGEYVPYVSGGRSATRSELPWHAGVYTKSKRPFMQICGGSVIAHSVVISAAHCFWGELEKLPASQYVVAAGKLYRPWNEPNDKHAQKSDVLEIKIPAYFRGHTTNLQDDIALLILARPLKYTEYVRPVCLNFDTEADSKDLTPGTLGKVGGWGLTSEDGPASPVLKVVELPVVELSECFNQSDPAFRAHITSDKICAGFRNGTAVCKGDSGGGLAFLSRGRYSLRGLVSGSPQTEHLCNTLAWASFTHLLTHERFIKETMTTAAAM